MKTNLYICEQRIPLTQQATLRQRLLPSIKCVCVFSLTVAALVQACTSMPFITDGQVIDTKRMILTK